ncbi:UDP-N-acetylglucosamine transporter TMEM241-like isoform X2 [Narcine bancroftii]|uniref:UDP-N-acetylglucosamine transporter TMEM241-like isoform X2 n=1 Tax=Narcine bancroftii TaxID=1343680 RepID=UPI003831C8B7
MWFKRIELCFSLLFIASYFTNKYVLSILKFTYPTLFQGWQTIVGTLLLQIVWKLGWLELRSSFLWSAKISWLPGALLFVGSIYAGSRALSKLSTSEVLATVTLKMTNKEKLSCTKIGSTVMIFTASAILLLNIHKNESDSFFWAVIHVTCAGGYKVFQKLKSCSLSEMEQQYLSYLYSMALLVCAAYPSGDAFDVLTFPFLSSYQFHSGCCASGILGVSLKFLSVKLKNCVSKVRYGAWILLTKVLATCLSLAAFEILLNIPTSCCLVLGMLGEALLIYTSISESDINE